VGAPAYSYLDSAEQVSGYVDLLSAEGEVALDLEADSLYSFPERVCLVQISSRRGNAILDALAVGDGMLALGTLIQDPRILKVLHGGDYDIRLMKKAYGFAVANVADTMIAAQLLGRDQLGLAALLAESMGVQVEKRYQRANWARRPLPKEMRDYAALDTAYLLRLWHLLRDELVRLGRLTWAVEEFDLLAAVEPAPDRPATWFDVKGAYKLSTSDRAVLQSLVTVREAVALAWNRPPFKVLGNGVLLAWAREPPESISDVVGTRGANRGILRRLASQILQAVRRGQKIGPRGLLEPDTVRHSPLSPEERRTLQRLKEVRRTAADRLGLDPGLVVTTATLARLARSKPQEAAALLRANLKDWQFNVLHHDLLEEMLG